MLGLIHGLHHAGNFLRVPADYLVMTCDHERAALSALPDGVDPQAEPAVPDALASGRG
ncbi:hypothetical protein [Micromonospora avicenniae]|uniref:hypothetical protein n=1 Tax=Micromonospora avicenniae TaxID=1198245 RepID=UPI00331B2491